MSWPRVGELRTLELGAPGEMRDKLNSLVLTGSKRATVGLHAEYEEEGELLEHVGEHLALLSNDGHQVATVEVTDVQVLPFDLVPWEFAAAEGEGDADLEEWRAGHRRYWASVGTPVEGETQVVCMRFMLA